MQKLGKRVKVKSAEPLADYRMRLIFEDVRIEGGTIAWPNGANIDPDVLYYDLIPAWMEETEAV